MTVRDLLVAGTEELSRAGVPSPRVDAEWLLAHALGVSRTELYADGDQAPADRARVFRELVARRAAREPLAYVLGEWGFRRLTLRVDPRVLIPRPETEELVERCLELIADRAEPAVLDIGTGSGAIALAIADEHPGARVVGTDTSADALAVAARERRSDWRCASSSSRASCSRGSTGRSTSSSPTRRTWRPRTSLHYRPRSASTSRAQR